jgi:hypothetical protein
MNLLFPSLSIHTIDVLALCQVAVVLAGEECAPVAAHDAFNIAVGGILDVPVSVINARFTSSVVSHSRKTFPRPF